MGWTFYPATHRTNKGEIDRKAELDSQFTWSEDNNKRSCTVLKSAMRGSTYYAAVRSKNETTGFDTVFGLVCLTRLDNRSYYNFGYKDMDETMGPYCYDCPKGILDLLSPTDSEWANAWRKKCRENLNQKKEKKPLAVGTVIEYESNGKTKRAILHEAAYQFKRPFWMSMDGRCYIPRTHIPKNYRIITE